MTGIEITVHAGGREAQTTVELAPGEHLDHVDVAFDNRTRVVGRVIDVASKQAVAGLGVSVQLLGGRPQTTKTDGDDRFELTDMPRGEAFIGLDRYEYVGLGVLRQLAGDEVELGDIYTVKRHIGEPRGSIGVTMLHDRRIVEIDPAGPAAKTELRVGDVVTSIDGVDAGVLASETVEALFEPPPGTAVHLELARGATVTVVAAP